jgi:hypothetical protein
MFVRGDSEAIALQGTKLSRYSFVWIGDEAGENSQGIDSTHPLCALVYRLIETYGFLGSWFTCLATPALREFEKSAYLLRLSKHGWQLDPDTSTTIRGTRNVERATPWPFAPEPALRQPFREILLLGSRVEWNDLARQPIVVRQRAVLGEDLIDAAEIVSWLTRTNSVAVSFGTTHTSNSPGLSVIGQLRCEPEKLVDAKEVAATYRGEDAARAWSHARLA